MITVLKPGLCTTIQDLGRYGYQKYGVVVGGAMDSYSHRIANMLVGMEENAPTLEITLVGPVLQFHQDALVAICGGDLSPSINNHFMPMWRPFFVKKDSILRFGHCKKGCRAYLAIAGGIDVPMVMESKSTYIRGKIGGLHGEALKANDVIPTGPLNETSDKMMKKLNEAPPKWHVPSKPISPILRVTKGRHFHLFSLESQTNLYETNFEITKNSDRMGYRLNGTGLSLMKREEMISEAVDFGTVQITSDGNPVVLLADRQTTGGYPKIAQVISVDLPHVAQMKPGDRICFREVTLEEAQNIFREEEQFFKIVKKAIEIKFR